MRRGVLVLRRNISHRYTQMIHAVSATADETANFETRSAEIA
jgi:hypothetical protein